MGAFQIFCKQKIVGKAWAVIQRRLDNSVDFYRDWGDYKRGFGHLSGSFWLGLEKIHRLTNQKHQNKLRVELEEFAGSRCYAEYDNFTVNGENDGYRLARLGFYQGIYVFSSFQTISSLSSLPNLAGIQLKKCHTNGKTRERSGHPLSLIMIDSYLRAKIYTKRQPKPLHLSCHATSTTWMFVVFFCLSWSRKMNGTGEYGRLLTLKTFNTLLGLLFFVRFLFYRNRVMCRFAQLQSWCHLLHQRQRFWFLSGFKLRCGSSRRLVV